MELTRDVLFMMGAQTVRSCVNTDRALEARVIAALNNAGAPVPLALWADPDGDELGAPTLISEFVDGQNMLQAARSGARDATDLVSTVASWLQADHDGLTGKVLKQPERADIDAPVNEQLIVELYSK